MTWAIPWSILDHPLWPELLPCLRVTSRGGSKSVRIDVLVGSTKAKREAFLAIEIRCCHCGAMMHPVRTRRGYVTTPFLNVSCSNDAQPGCCRGGNASEEEKRVVAAIKGLQASPRQTGLF